MTPALGELPAFANSLGSPPPTPWGAILPFIAILCMLDIARHPHTQRFPPRIWLAICAFGNVFGLFAYVRFGRGEDQ